MFNGFNGYLGGWGYAAMMLGMLVIVGLAVWVVTVSSRLPRKSGAPALTVPDEELLARRFARGEIDEQQYAGQLAAFHARALP